MGTPKQTFYANQAASIIKMLEARQKKGYSCATIEEAKAKVVELLGNKSKSVAYGGSMTIDENGFKDSITAAGHKLILRENYKTPEETKELKALQINADDFLMSTNAITLDGELVNIDGRGNRVCYLIYGPDEVIVVAGMNKVVANVDDAIRRIRNEATPPNCNRLNCDTPCAVTGKCGDCYTNSICCQIVVTRVSLIKDRIKVILVGDTLGY